MTAAGGKSLHRGGVMGRMEASARPLRAPHSERAMRAVHAGPLTGLIAQVLLLAVLAADRRPQRRGWIVGLTCAVIIDAVLAHGLSRHSSEGLGRRPIG